MKEALPANIEGVTSVNKAALANMAPRLRMMTLYAVSGTGNRSEAYVEYFTKWGDVAHGFHPIFDGKQMIAERMHRAIEHKTNGIAVYYLP